jgi:carbamate kinase
MRIVAALGGNALLRRGESARVESQRRNLAIAALSLAPLATEHELVLTHGNGPQVGLLALQAEALHDVPPYPLDVLGAESQGMIGYLLAEALRDRLPEREVAVVLTRVIVDRNDSAFRNPTKPIGLVYTKRHAKALAAERGWVVAADGNGFRRVVPSPTPREIVEVAIVRRLIAAGTLVVCAGGGGVPVVRSGNRLRGVEAVIDKDRTAALLAESLEADILVLLTDVPLVVRGWGTPAAEPIERATPEELRLLEFATGSMGPKIEAVCRFVERTGGRAAIGSLEEAAAVIDGSAGTQVLPKRSRRRRRVRQAAPLAGD